MIIVREYKKPPIFSLSLNVFTYVFRLKKGMQQIRFESVSNKKPNRLEESNGTDWIRNGTELDSKNSKAEPKRIWNCSLVTEKGGTELNFRFLFFVFLSLSFQSLWLWKERRREATEAAPSPNWVFRFANSEFEFQQSIAVRIRLSQHILAVNSWLQTHEHIYPIGYRYNV